MAGGLPPKRSLLQAARAAPSQIEETPAASPRGEATHGTNAGRGATVPLPAGKVTPGGTPGPQPPAPPETALSPSRTSWTAFTG